MSLNHKPVTCKCCNKLGQHGGRGLISSCYTRHTKAGTLHRWPPVRHDNDWRNANRPAEDPPPAGHWHDHAACKSVDPEIFWPPSNTPPVLARHLETAGPICAGCPVRSECLDYALATGQPDGIWAGTTPQQRRTMRQPAISEGESA